MKAKRRGTGITRLLSIPPIPINPDLHPSMDRDRGMPVMMKEDVPTVVERPDRSMIENIHLIGDMENPNIELKLIQTNTTTRMIIIEAENHIKTTDQDHTLTSLPHFLFVDTRPRRVCRYLIKCPTLVICHYRDGSPGQGLDQCNMLLLQVHSLDMEEGD